MINLFFLFVFVIQKCSNGANEFLLLISTVPEQPRKLRGDAPSSTSIRLMWDPPETVGGTATESIDRYELYYNDTAGDRSFKLTISPPINNILVEDLVPNTEYSFKVSAASSRGEGTSSSPILVRTLEAGNCSSWIASRNLLCLLNYCLKHDFQITYKL